MPESEKAPPYGSPWSVSLMINNSSGVSAESHHLCSGSIIDKFFIITLAKCINMIPYGSKIEIIAPSDESSLWGGYSVPMQKILVSEIFIRSSTFNDNVRDEEIAVVQLMHPLDFSNYIQKISHVRMSKTLPGTVVYYYGWTEYLYYGKTFNAMTVRI